VIQHILLAGDMTASAWSGSRPRHFRVNSHDRQTGRAWRWDRLPARVQMPRKSRAIISSPCTPVKRATGGIYQTGRTEWTAEYLTALGEYGRWAALMIRTRQRRTLMQSLWCNTRTSTPASLGYVSLVTPCP
jgi:hypothetical protein